MAEDLPHRSLGQPAIVDQRADKNIPLDTISERTTKLPCFTPGNLDHDRHDQVRVERHLNPPHGHIRQATLFACQFAILLIGPGTERLAANRFAGVRPGNAKLLIVLRQSRLDILAIGALLAAFSTRHQPT